MKVELDARQLARDEYRANEAFKALRTNILFCGDDTKVIALTSATPNEGKSSVSLNLAASLEVKNATLMWPVRIAAAGKMVTPGGAVEICHILGKEETLRRLRLGLAKLTA